jgi:Na+-transporting NADH:ubiquinone oxidoreductase subunit C
MKKGLLTIAFMIVITIVFISALASIHELSKERIEQNLKIDQYKSVLYAFDIFPENVNERELGLTSTTNDIPWQVDQVLKNINDQIKTIKIPISSEQRQFLKNSFLTWHDSAEIYIRVNQANEIVAYGFPLKGKGLWGSITAFGVISADLSKMVGIDFTEQVETPGLGARITESEFKYFFRNLDLSHFQDHSSSGEQPIVIVKKKIKTNVDESINSLQAITGATQTVNGVLAMINTDLRFYINLIKDNGELIRKAVGLYSGLMEFWSNESAYGEAGEV